jgi:acetate---CoA ligase (ADP-forming) subunit beta
MTPFEIIEQAEREGRDAVPEHLGKQILAAYGIATPKSMVISDAAQAEHAWAVLKPPLVAKILSRDVIHKSDIGGVRINLSSLDDLTKAVKEIGDAVSQAGSSIEGYLVEEMAPPGQEVVIGGTINPGFGPVLMVGLGGIFVETLADVSFRICPITAIDGAEMLGELKAAPLLAGARGAEAVSQTAIIETLLAIGGENGLLTELSDVVSELDINPLIVSASGAVAADARFILSGKKG